MKKIVSVGLSTLIVILLVALIISSAIAQDPTDGYTTQSSSINETQINVILWFKGVPNPSLTVPIVEIRNGHIIGNPISLKKPVTLDNFDQFGIHLPSIDLQSINQASFLAIILKENPQDNISYEQTESELTKNVFVVRLGLTFCLLLGFGAGFIIRRIKEEVN